MGVVEVSRVFGEAQKNYLQKKTVRQLFFVFFLQLCLDFPIIRKKRPENFTGLDDKTSYQTVFAKNYGSIAAPTAGLHFSDEAAQKNQQKSP